MSAVNVVALLLSVGSAALSQSLRLRDLVTGPVQVAQLGAEHPARPELFITGGDIMLTDTAAVVGDVFAGGCILKVGLQQRVLQIAIRGALFSSHCIPLSKTSRKMMQ